MAKKTSKTKKPASKKAITGRTAKGGSVTRLARRRTSKYEAVKAAVMKLKPGQDYIIQVPAGIQSDRFRNNIYHAIRELREDGWFRMSRSKDMKSVIVNFEKN